MAIVSHTPDHPGGLSASVAMCVDSEALDRFAIVLRNLLVGLVDQAIDLRLVSCDPRVETLTLGPIQTVVHEPVVWPLAGRRTDALLDVLSQRPPTIVHAMSSASYWVSGAISEAFDSDLVVQVTSLADCNAAARLNQREVRRYVTHSEPLVSVLVGEMKLPAESISLIRPGVLASKQITCFTDPDRVPAILCVANFERKTGVDRLIAAIDILHQREHNFMLFLLGHGRRESALRRMIKERKLASLVTFAHPSGDLTGVMRGADIFVSPSPDTVFRADALQAMGAGIVVVAVPSPICDYFRNGTTAVVCDQPTPESLADALEFVLSDRERAQGIAGGGMEHVRTNHAMSGMAQETADTYRKIALARATFSISERQV